ncbi:unnamed protein product [Lampetra fluviatilis]
MREPSVPSVTLAPIEGRLGSPRTAGEERLPVPETRACGGGGGALGVSSLVQDASCARSAWTCYKRFATFTGLCPLSAARAARPQFSEPRGPGRGPGATRGGGGGEAPAGKGEGQGEGTGEGTGQREAGREGGESVDLAWERAVACDSSPRPSGVGESAVRRESGEMGGGERSERRETEDRGESERRDGRVTSDGNGGAGNEEG